jgi:hypothetical protein
MFSIHEKRIRRAKKARAHLLNLKTNKTVIKGFTMVSGAPQSPKIGKPDFFTKARNFFTKLFMPRGLATAGRAR